MRTKEDAQDYRYFPDPDLPPLEVSEALIDRTRSELPELPQARRERYERDHALSAYDAGLLTQSREWSDYFEASLEAAGAGTAKQLANWMTGDLAAALNRDELDIGRSKVSPQSLAALLRRSADGTLSSKLAREVFAAMWQGEGEPDAIIEKRGLKQITDTGELDAIVAQVIAANPKSVEEFRAGKEKAFNALVGQAMKATRGKGSPAAINELLRKKLS
jgi:aspartyl-tRNA(Asn)/glutamyl-tRNA(Gln) amidotransferase subunit B